MTAVYLSASSLETPRARVIRTELEREGVTVVGSGWIESVEVNGSLGLTLPQETRMLIAHDWHVDIVRCHALLALVPDDHVSVGLIAEVSIARALGRPVVLASKTPPERLHPALLSPTWVTLSEDMAAMHAAVRMARRG